MYIYIYIYLYLSMYTVHTSAGSMLHFSPPFVFHASKKNSQVPFPGAALRTEMVKNHPGSVLQGLDQPDSTGDKVRQ